jgi:hypothetical protein
VSEYESLGELGRAFNDFRQESRDQMKFIMRLVLTTLGAAVLGGVINSIMTLRTGA